MEGIRLRKDIDNPEFFTKKMKERKEEIMALVYFYSPKIQNHLKNCPEWKNETSNISQGNLPECVVCNKFLCFLDCMLFEEKKMGKEVDFEKMQNSGTTEYMIFGDGIKILE